MSVNNCLTCTAKRIRSEGKRAKGGRLASRLAAARIIER